MSAKKAPAKKATASKKAAKKATASKKAAKPAAKKTVAAKSVKSAKKTDALEYFVRLYSSF
ncbi:MAG TPA: hypothetical protein VNW71_09530 [Thermoanaerobaculia bacterium]|nr:hypothetical protein [Thermoanaerobaculia bacterium]